MKAATTSKIPKKKKKKKNAEKEIDTAKFIAG